jgi:hypothetical protein
LNLLDNVMARLVRATHDLRIEGHGVAGLSDTSAFMGRLDKPGDDDREGEMIEFPT